MSLLSNKQKRKTQIRDRSLFIAVGGGGGGLWIFVATTEPVRDPPLKHTGWFLNQFKNPPTLAVENFMTPPLLSQPPQKASVTICKQVTSILILTSHETWTTTLHIWSSDMNCIVCEGLLFSSKLFKKSHCRSRPPHCRILPYILHPLISRHFHLWYHTIRLCSQTRVYVSVIMTSYSFYRLCQASDQWWSVRVLSGRSQVLLPLNFRSVSCLTTTKWHLEILSRFAIIHRQQAKSPL